MNDKEPSLLVKLPIVTAHDAKVLGLIDGVSCRIRESLPMTPDEAARLKAAAQWAAGVKECAARGDA